MSMSFKLVLCFLSCACGIVMKNAAQTQLGQTVQKSQDKTCVAQSLSERGIASFFHYYAEYSEWNKGADFGFDLASKATPEKIDGVEEGKTEEMLVHWRKLLNRYQGNLQNWKCASKGEKATTHTHMVGPFITMPASTIRFAFDDIGFLSEAFKQHDEISVTYSHTGAADKDGNWLEVPPLNPHHIHFTKSPGGNEFESKNKIKCLLTGRETVCPSMSRSLAMVDYPDFQCKSSEGGTDCTAYSPPEGTGWNLKEPVAFWGDMNDVRVEGAGPLEWYYQIQMKWEMPKRAASLYLISAPTWTPSFARLLTFQVPLKTESFKWMSFNSGINGMVRDVKLHTHALKGEVHMFKARPSELGLSQLREKYLKDQDAWIVASPQEVGFTSNQEVKDYVLSNFNGSGKSESALHIKATGVYEIKDNTFYPRLAPLEGFESKATGGFRMEKGEAYTSVAFWQPIETPLEPYNVDKVDGVDVLVNHLAWYFYYDDDVPTALSTETATYGGLEPEDAVYLTSYSDLLASVIYSGYSLPPKLNVNNPLNKVRVYAFVTWDFILAGYQNHVKIAGGVIGVLLLAVFAKKMTAKKWFL